MQVKYIGVDGRIRRTFDNVNSMWQHEGNEIVTINRKVEWIQTEGGIPVGSIDERPGFPPLRPFSQEYAIAILHLAQGEYTEIVDEPTRS